jgi:hypothetical protein
MMGGDGGFIGRDDFGTYPDGWIKEPGNEV